MDKLKKNYKVNPSKKLLLNTKWEKLYKTDIIQVN